MCPLNSGFIIQRSAPSPPTLHFCSLTHFSLQVSSVSPALTFGRGLELVGRFTLCQTLLDTI